MTQPFTLTITRDEDGLCQFILESEGAILAKGTSLGAYTITDLAVEALESHISITSDSGCASCKASKGCRCDEATDAIREGWA